MDMLARAARAFCHLQLRSLSLGASIVEGERGVIIMLCGTAGTGKSTLASLLAQRLGITTVLSTDSVRHGLRCRPLFPATASPQRQLPVLISHQGSMPSRSRVRDEDTFVTNICLSWNAS